KDIILYTKKESTKKILESLKEMAEYANGHKLKDDEYDRVHEAIFKIVKTLSCEVDLGGSIDEDMEVNLRSLEQRIVPEIEAKEYMKKFLDKLDERLSEERVPVAFEPARFEGEYLWISVEDSPVSLF